MKKKLNGAGGFTVVEMLCAVAVLALLCLMLGTGMQMALTTYRDITAESETQLLLNTLVDAISDELRYAYPAEVGEDPDPKLTLSGGQIYDADNKELLPKEKPGTGKGGAYHGGAYEVVSMSYPYLDGCFTLHLKVHWTENTDISAETPEDGVVIRCLNAPKKAAGTGEGTEGT